MCEENPWRGYSCVKVGEGCVKFVDGHSDFVPKKATVSPDTNFIHWDICFRKGGAKRFKFPVTGSEF